MNAPNTLITLNMKTENKSNTEWLEFKGVTRVEVIDQNGRSYVNWNETNTVKAMLQDQGRTLKIFIKSSNLKTADTLRKCKVTRYNPEISEPPYETIYLNEFEVYEPPRDSNDLGTLFALRLRHACHSLGYEMKFYTMLYEDKKYDYEVVVY